MHSVSCTWVYLDRVSVLPGPCACTYAFVSVCVRAVGFDVLANHMHTNSQVEILNHKQDTYTRKHT